MSSDKNPIIVAIDTPDIQRAAALCTSLNGHVGAVKLGLEFFSAHGADGVREVLPKGLPLFLDLKFHDIPNTVGKAIRALKGLPIELLTIHTSGGAAMMQAAKEAADWLAEQGQKRPNILGVTVLTSMDKGDLEDVGVMWEVADQVKRLALLAKQHGLDGLVCSPQEVAMLREIVDLDSSRRMLLVAPGIRPIGAESGDQKRTMTPQNAMDAGADYLVIGRPITGADDPVKAVNNLGLYTA